MNEFENELKDSIKKKLVENADKMIKDEIINIRGKLWTAATNEIDRIVNLIDAVSFDNTATMTREVHISLKGKL